ncbi:MAG: response regulator [Anaerolineae bacterium]|jgi:CheY-like chemotaxis protein
MTAAPDMLDNERKMIGPSYRILVADDDEQMRFLWRGALLKPAGVYDVVTTADGCQALQELARATFDLVVTDLRMPGIDGLELTQILRQAGNQVSIIWISGLAPQDMDEQAERLGVYCCLRKPLRVAQIREAVADAVAEATAAAGDAPRLHTQS